MKTILYRFAGGADGSYPSGSLVFDRAGNLYGTTGLAGSGSGGTVYKLTPASGGTWSLSVLYSFTGGSDGRTPLSGVIFDQFGNLYGTTFADGNPGCFSEIGCGTVFQLTPSGSGWTETTLYTFTGGNDGGNPEGGLAINQSSNLYGNTSWGGSGASGTVFQYASPALKTIYSFSGGAQGGYPEGGLSMDSVGNLYGTTYAGGPYGAGTVFKLTNDSWTYTDLHDFTLGNDGGWPRSNVVFDANGNLFGTTTSGGAGTCYLGCGVVWEITP